MQNLYKRNLVQAVILMTAITVSASSWAQSTSTYSYDALGRLITARDGTGKRTDYELDMAGNRKRAVVAQDFGRVWEAESLPHAIGYADGDGWAANVTMPNGHLTYGPYVTDIPPDGRVASWRMAIDVRNASNDVVATVDVYDATAGQELASRVIRRLEWAADQTYQPFELSFTLDASRAGHAIEMRTFYHSRSYLKVDKISVR